MERIVEVDEEGRLIIPQSVMGDVKPHTRYRVEEEGNALRVVPVEEGQPLWATLSPKERAAELGQWLKSLQPKARHLSDEAMRRENMYD